MSPCMRLANLPISLSVSPKSPWLTADNSKFPKSKQQTSDFQDNSVKFFIKYPKNVISSIEKATQKTPGNIVLLVAHTVRKQRFEATSY